LQGVVIVLSVEALGLRCVGPTESWYKFYVRVMINFYF
jgi:hypothetical protein